MIHGHTKRAWNLGVVCVLLFAGALGGCSIPSGKNTVASLPPTQMETLIPSATPQASPVATSSAPQASPIATASANPTQGIEQSAKILPTGTADAKILPNITLRELGGYLDAVMIKGKCDQSITYDNMLYDVYYYRSMGIALVSYTPRAPMFSFVECDMNRVDFLGIKKGMNFEQIQSILGKTDVVRINRGLPQSVSYELRYVADGVKLKFISWKEDGSSVQLNVVKDFSTEGEFIRVTPKQIGEYLLLDKKAILAKLGNPDEQGDGSIDYKKIGISFGNEENGKYEVLRLDDRYEINGVRNGMTLNQVIKIMGPAKIKASESEEDPFAYVEYKYGSFGIQFWTEDIGGGKSTVIYPIFYRR